MTNVSIIITTYKASTHLHCCVLSLLRTIEKDDIEVVIYGDGGGEESKLMIAECSMVLEANGIKVVSYYNPVNSGICKALNEACSLATREWLFIVNDDMVFPANWWEDCKKHLKHSRVLSTSAIEPPLPGRGIADCVYKENLGLDPDNFKFDTLDEFQSRLKKDDLESGVNYPFFIERELFFGIGKVDENFPGPYHDPDLFLRLRNAGIELLRLNSVALYHFSGISLRFGENASDVSTKKSLNWIKKENSARLYFIKKWGCKPKARFGYIPKATAHKLWKEAQHSAFEKIKLFFLLLMEKAKAELREARYK